LATSRASVVRWENGYVAFRISKAAALLGRLGVVSAKEEKEEHAASQETQGVSTKEEEERATSQGASTKSTSTKKEARARSSTLNHERPPLISS